MSRRNKLQKFAELQQMPNFYQCFSVAQPQLIGHGNREVDLKGLWAARHFANDQPIILELGCGRGEYAVGLAVQSPDKNFIGVDVKGARMWQGARRALQENIANVAFLRTRIECLDAFFASEEIDEIWITFPDPFPRTRKANRRLTAPEFLDRYRSFLRDSGIVHLKTDDTQLYDFTIDTVETYTGAHLQHASADIYSGELPHPALTIKTHYEQMHLTEGKKIKYVRFALPIKSASSPEP